MSSLAIDPPGVMGQVREAVAQAQPQAKTMQVVGLPGFVRWFFQIFAIVIYGPDMYFGYQIYTKGGALISDNGWLAAGEITLFATLSAGTVGMAYLLSVLAPYHWRKGHKGIAFLCGVGVLIATGVTILFSLAYRGEHPVNYAFDATVQSWIPALATWHISPIQSIAAFAPPFWGLFWALVQPTDARSDDDIEADDPDAVAKIQQRAAIKAAQIEARAKLKQTQAVANSQSRAVQLGGLVQTVRDAGKAIGTQVVAAVAVSAEDDAAQAPVTPEIASPPYVDTPTGEMPVMNLNAPPQSATPSRPRPGSPAYKKWVRKAIGRIESQLLTPTVKMVADALGESEADVTPVFNEIMRERRATTR